MIVKQEKLIKDIAEKERVGIATVRDIFKTAEEIIFDYLSSATPTKNVVIKVFDGLKLESKYVPKKANHGCINKDSNPKICAKPKITKHYNAKLNKA